ncbi:hypothetical protein Tco_0433392 [Tanacetum coccineum]
MDKGSKERSPPHNLGKNRVNTYAVRITMLIADIEDDIMDPVMQCTTLPSHLGFSQQKLVSFVTEIHTTSIDFLTPKHPSDTYVLTIKMEILLEPASNKLLVGYIKIQLKSDSLPHAHAQSTKTFYKHQDSRIMKAQELKTKTSAQTLIYKIFLQRYQVYQGRLLASFQDDAKYEHVGQDTRSQGGKDDQDKQGKDLKISDIKTKSKDNDKGSRSKITKHEGTSLQRIQRPRPQDLNDKSNLIDLMKECHNELTSGEIVSLKILSRTMEVRS